MTTTPAAAASWKPARVSSRATSVKISSTRGWMISDRIWRESWRALRPPTERHVDGLVLGHERGERAAVALLELLGVGRRRAQPDRDVVGDVIAAERDDRGVPDGAVAEERDVGGAAADVDEEDAQLLLLGGQHRLRRGERLQHDVLHREAGAVDAPDHVLHRGDGAGDDVHLDLEPHAGHAERLPHAVLVVDHEGLGQHVDDLAVLRAG